MTTCSNSTELRELLLNGEDPRNIDYHFVSDMSHLFKNWPTDKIPQLDTRRVLNMEGMFEGCKRITSIPFMDTSNVTNMKGMFKHCSFLKKIPKLNTKRVKNMNNMFWNCWKLEEVSKINTENTKNMKGMFGHCYSLKTIPEIDTKNVIDMHGMFYHCYDLETLPELNTEKNKMFIFMFEECDKLNGPTKWITMNFDNMNNITNKGENFIRIFGFENVVDFLKREGGLDEFAFEAIINSKESKSLRLLARKSEKVILL